jgi:hypothetical protein
LAIKVFLLVGDHVERTPGQLAGFVVGSSLRS